MKVNKLFAAGLSLLSIFAVSCDNTIELVAPYQEIGVVYGLINPADSIHYVRIQKAFLGEGNALVMAQVPDSTYYPDILDVRLYRYKDGVEMGSFPLTRFVGPPKDPGEFPQSPNILYKSNGEIINRDSEYRLVAINTQTGHVIQAQTPIVDSLKILRPTTFEKIRWANGPDWESANPVLVEYVPTPNGKVYGMVVRFKYLEENISSGVVTPKHIDWVFPNEVVNNPQSISTIQEEINGESFYKIVGSSLQANPLVRRYIGNIDFIFTAGAEFLANYVAINQSTTSILTTPPDYSNVDGGTGIFSSRFVQYKADKEMDTQSIDSLKSGQYTGDLGFE